jgi:peptidoglycan/LPS O-acetylase OafA/YrhL
MPVKWFVKAWTLYKNISVVYEMANMENRQYQFDFIKGIAIISVILIHAGIREKYFYNYWNGQAVPLFITVSCILGCLSLFKIDSLKNYFAKDKVKRTLLRIFKPFILAQILLVAIYIVLNKFSIKVFLVSGGLGIGCYYPWIYLQLWVLIPFMFYLMKKNAIIGSIIIILVSISTNILFSTFSSSEWLEIPFVNHINYKKEIFVALYILCVNRYLFIFPLAYLLVEERLKYNLLLFLSFFGAVFIYCLKYKNVNLEPFIYDSGRWKAYEFPSHFYTILL